MFIINGSGSSIYKELDQDMYFEALALYEIVFASGLLWSNLNCYIATVTTIVFYVFNLNFFKQNWSGITTPGSGSVLGIRIRIQRPQFLVPDWDIKLMVAFFFNFIYLQIQQGKQVFSETGQQKISGQSRRSFIWIKNVNNSDH